MGIKLEIIKKHIDHRNIKSAISFLEFHKEFIDEDLKKYWLLETLLKLDWILIGCVDENDFDYIDIISTNFYKIVDRTLIV